MELSIITPNETADYVIEWIELNTPTGNIVIQPGHTPMILILESDKPAVFRLENGTQESITVRQGIADIRRDRATLVINETV